MKSALVMYPHQLFPLSELPDVETVIMVEEPLYFGTDREFPLNLHKQKLILHRASMRRYAEEILWPAKLDVEYIGLDVLYDSSDILERAKKFDQLIVFDPIHDLLVHRLLEARRQRPSSPEIQFLPSPNFFLKDQEARQFLGAKHGRLFEDFYRWQRERFNILIDENYKPVGGQLSFEANSDKKIPKDQVLPSFGVFGDNDYVKEATQFVEQHFRENPGSTDFVWPTNHAEARQWLENFLTDRIDNFGLHQQAIDGQAPWLYHSAIAGSLNIGLLSPHEVVEAALKRHAKKPVPMESLESFIRQILGWREFSRGLYIAQGAQMRRSNVFKNRRKLTPAWYRGELGIPPYDDMVKKVSAHAYAHHNERLTIAGSLMVMAEIDPEEINRWYSELFIDAYDWESIPNLYGLSQFADGDVWATKPHLNSSNHILQLSHYERGIWSDVWDGLYWRFIEKHRALLKHNPHMRPIVQRLDRLDADRRRIISYRAEDFLTKHTLLN